MILDHGDSYYFNFIHDDSRLFVILYMGYPFRIYLNISYLVHALWDTHLYSGFNHHEIVAQCITNHVVYDNVIVI